MKYIYVLLASAALYACGNNDHQHDHNNTKPVSQTGEKELKDYKTHDPVCGMPREESWTHYSVYNNDTVYFCAEICKKGFDGNPEKYTAVK